MSDEMQEPRRQAVPPDLEEGRRLLEAATKGPWLCRRSWRDPDWFGDDFREDTECAWQIQGGVPDDPGEGWALLHAEVEKGTITPQDADLDLIVWLRNNAESLLASREEADRLRPVLERMARFADACDLRGHRDHDPILHWGVLGENIFLTAGDCRRVRASLRPASEETPE